MSETTINNIALVNENDEILSFAEKLHVHQQGLLHRAFSIFIFNSEGKMLLQQRAHEKYHSGGLWTNACCSHLAEDENFEDAIHQRLLLEMGFDCALSYAFKFHYKVTFSNGLTENEIDHVFTGTFNGTPKPNPSEACAYKWMGINEIKEKLNNNPENYTYWFKIAFEKLLEQKLLNQPKI